MGLTRHQRHNPIRTMAAACIGLVLAAGNHAAASDNRLVVEQIGDGNTSAAYQGARPSTGELEALGFDTGADQFSVHDAGSFSPDSSGEFGSFTNDTSIADLLDDLPGAPGSGEISILQQGRENRALAVQAGGYGNRLETRQFGNNNLGVHLQAGNNNYSVLEQYGDNNTNALIARDGASGPAGAPLTLRSHGNVRGFSVQATGPQNYSTIDVQANSTGGYNVDFR